MRIRTAGSDPGPETLRRRNLGSTVFLVTSAFQENKVVSPLSARVCKQNTHLPGAPQTHSSQLQVGGSACSFCGSSLNLRGRLRRPRAWHRAGPAQTTPHAGEPDGGVPSGGRAPGDVGLAAQGRPSRAHGETCTFSPWGQAVRCERVGGDRCREGGGWSLAEEKASGVGSLGSGTGHRGWQLWRVEQGESVRKHPTSGDLVP